MSYSIEELFTEDLPLVIITGGAGALIGASTAVVAKGVLGVFAVSLLTGSYGSVALLGMKIFGSMMGGVGIALCIHGHLKINNECLWRTIFLGFLAVVPVVWLSAIPVTTALAMAALNIAVSALTVPFSQDKDWKNPDNYLPIILLSIPIN